MARPMEEAEWRAFLAEGTRTGKLAVVRADGRPHVVPIWFVVDHDGALRFNTGGDGLKANAMRRDPRVCLVVDEEVPPYAFVKVEAIAELGDDPDEVRRVATACGARYMGAHRAEEYGRRNGVPGELVVTLRPTRVVSARDVAG